jgi:hypothetical protein
MTEMMYTLFLINRVVVVVVAFIVVAVVAMSLSLL